MLGLAGLGYGEGCEQEQERKTANGQLVEAHSLPPVALAYRNVQ